MADNISHAAYDSASDELVLAIRYSGTNADHGFSLRWDVCKAGGEGGPQEASAEVLDDQWRDAARTEFKKTVRLSLAGMPCRPARLTLLIAPRFYTTLQIP